MSMVNAANDCSEPSYFRIPCNFRGLTIERHSKQAEYYEPQHDEAPLVFNVFKIARELFDLVVFIQISVSKTCDGLLSL